MTTNPPTANNPTTLAALALAGALVLAGCAPIFTGDQRTMAAHNETPVATNFPTTTQNKLQAGQHWLAIADDAGRAVVAGLKKGAGCLPVSTNCKLVFVKPPEPMTAFGRAFHNQLITSLVKQGVPVSKNPGSDLVAEVDIQPVVFSPNRPQYRYAGTPAELAPGVWAIREVATAIPFSPEFVPPFISAYHWFRTEFAAGKTPQMEILVTVSIGNSSRYLSRSTNAYYIADMDGALYDSEICALFNICAASAADAQRQAPPPKPLPAASLGVTGDCTQPSCRYPQTDKSAKQKIEK